MSVEFYGQISNVDVAVATRQRLWRDCRLYLARQRPPSRTVAVEFPERCLGVVWLHNPSSGNRAPEEDQLTDWSRLPLRPWYAGRPHHVLAYIQEVFQRVEAMVRQRGQTLGTDNPHVRIEELIYLESTGISDLWGSPEPSQEHLAFIDRWSFRRCQMEHFRFPPPTAAKFMWLAWGGMVWGTTQKVPLSGGDLFGELIDEATRVAGDSRLDLIFVSPAQIEDTVNLSTYRARHDGTRYQWFRYEGGAAIATATPPGGNAEWNPFFNFPVHPFELCSRLEQPLYESVFSDLAAAIVDAIL